MDLAEILGLDKLREEQGTGGGEAEEVKEEKKEEAREVREERKLRKITMIFSCWDMMRS